MALDQRGLISVVLIHIVVSEPLYYALHRLFHYQPKLFKSYHSLHHLSPVLHPFTGIDQVFMILYLFYVLVILRGCLVWEEKI